MKTLALETILIAQSLVFWLFALPLAIVAFPLVTLGQKAMSLFSSIYTPADESRLTPRWA